MRQKNYGKTISNYYRKVQNRYESVSREMSRGRRTRVPKPVRSRESGTNGRPVCHILYSDGRGRRSVRTILALKTRFNAPGDLVK